MYQWNKRGGGGSDSVVIMGCKYLEPLSISLPFQNLYFRLFVYELRNFQNNMSTGMMQGNN